MITYEKSTDKAIHVLIEGHFLGSLRNFDGDDWKFSPSEYWNFSSDEMVIIASKLLELNKYPR